MELSLRKYFYHSTAAHLIALVFVATSPYLPFRKIDVSQEKILWVSLPKGVSGQLIAGMKKSEGLPKTTIQEQREAAKKVGKPADEKSEMTYESTAAKAPRKKTAEELRMEQALARVKQDVSKRAPAIPEAAQIPKGAEGGGIPSGKGELSKISPDDLEYIAYQMQIRDRIMSEWILPMKYARPGLGLICKIVVHINERGEILETEWEEKSGEASFDLSALRAIEKAAPLDVPPDKLKWEAVQEGFLVEFNPDVR